MANWVAYGRFGSLLVHLFQEYDSYFLTREKVVPYSTSARNAFQITHRALAVEKSGRVGRKIFCLVNIYRKQFHVVIKSYDYSRYSKYVIIRARIV